jgi:nitrate reductase gamma subunit
VISTAGYLFAYLCAALFMLGILVKVTRYKRNPLHLRWELYPVAHEGRKAKYGGSYLEEVDWMKKPRHKSLIGELQVMVPEIFFLKAVHESNRRLWSVTFPFHLGVYCTAGFMILLFGSAAAVAAGFPGLPERALTALLNILGVCGVVLSMAGAVGLICRRAADGNLRNYTSRAHYFNLGFFLMVMGLTLLAWFKSGLSFAGFQVFAAALTSFHIRQGVSLWIILPAVSGSALFAYIPWTHMAHFFMKYYLYHDIRWGDEPMSGAKGAEARLQRVLNYRPTWSAAHIQGDGQKTWAQLAMQNPTRAAEGAVRDNRKSETQ